MNTIFWKGVFSTTIDGLLISELPPISKPPLRVKETTIDGRDGSIIEELGYSSYDKTITIGLRGNFNINKIIKYFTGEGEIIFSNEPDKVYIAKIVDQIDYNRLLRFRTAVVKFRVQPFKYKYLETYKETQTATASGAILHIGNIYKILSLSVDSATGTIKTVGKNLFDYNANLIPNSSGLTNVVNGDGGITTSGIPNVNYAGVTHSFINSKLVNGHTYTISQKYLNKKVYMQLTTQNKESGAYEYDYLANKTKHTFVADTEHYTYSLTVQASALEYFGSQSINTTNYYQLEEGAVATEFEPYVSSSYAYTSTEKIEEHITVFSPRTTIINSTASHMSVEYIAPYEVFNEGLEDSKPKMVIHGSGTVGISVNGIHILDYTFPEGETEVVIDSEKEDAYLGEVLKNRNMNGEFPVLLAGTNKIEWSGDVESIEILPRSRWL